MRLNDLGQENAWLKRPPADAATGTTIFRKAASGNIRAFPP